ncbi:uncharacterized protein LOC111350006 isoform X1 [Spodoptera litura]|uniref:Regulatory protein zeste n=1 Tax=Spodoptera litura TaxID=69820 RepID=A0A9J7IKC3_SPOLT|nr:uncharacterized protein LOC111350006 isoform X1 [Spodoptera litura]
MSSQKSMPLTKEEVMQLVQLVEENPVVFSKATNASNNLLKDATWSIITDSFNALIASSPRKPEQLRLKWENLKKSARKRSTKIRMNNLKTGGGKPEFIPPDEALDKVAAILDASDQETIKQITVAPALSPHTPKSKLFFSSVSSKGKLKRQNAACDVKASVVARNRAITAYYDAKKKNEEEIATIKKRKLELEILELERRIYPDPTK